MNISEHEMGASPRTSRTLTPFASNWQASIPHMAVEKWENEGGRVEHLVALTERSASPSPRRNDADGMVKQLRLMLGTLAQDYANGRVGQRFNTYAHRSRMIQQMTAGLRELKSPRQG